MDSQFYVALIHALTGVIDNFQTFGGVAMPCREACPDMRHKVVECRMLSQCRCNKVHTLKSRGQQ